MKKVLRTIIKVFLNIGVFGTGITLFVPIIGFIQYLLGSKDVLIYEYYLFGLPFIVFAWPLGVFKSIKSGERKYGISFWGAIKNAPKWMNLLIWFFMSIMIILSVINWKWAIWGILPLFNYISYLIYLSSLIEKQK